MAGFVRAQYSSLGAVSAAAIVTLGLVTVPPTGDPLAASLTRVEVVAVQLQAQVSDFVQAATANAASTSATVSANAVSSAQVVASDTASPDPTTQFLQTVVFILALPLIVVTSPIWVPLGFIALLNFGFAFGRLDSHVPIQQGLPGWTVTSVVVGTPTVVGSAASVAGPAASLAPTTGSTPTAKARAGSRRSGNLLESNILRATANATSAHRASSTRRGIDTSTAVAPSPGANSADVANPQSARPAAARSVRGR